VTARSHARSGSRGSRGLLRAWCVALVAVAGVALLAGCADASLLPDSGGGGRLQGSIDASTAAESSASAQPTQAPTAQPKPAQPKPVVPADAPKTLKGTVTHVVDGDTAHVALATGVTEKVRFIGVNTPESTIEHEPYGKEASAYTKKALAGKTVYLETDAELRDRYGRLLAYVWLAQPMSDGDAEVRAKMFNARLLLDGIAEQATYPPNVKYVDRFAVYAREARNADRGLWGIAGAAAVGSGAAASGGSGASVPAPSAGAYIGNRNTKKFHYPACSSVGDMNPANKVPLPDRAAAVAGGYVPCKRCNP